MAKRVTAPRPGTKQPEWQTEIAIRAVFPNG